MAVLASRTQNVLKAKSAEMNFPICCSRLTQGVGNLKMYGPHPLVLLINIETLLINRTMGIFLPLSLEDSKNLGVHQR